MATEKKVTVPAVVSEKKSVEKIQSEAQKPVTKTATRKTAVKKSETEKSIKKEKASVSVSKTEKNTKKEKPARKTAEPSLDHITTVLWKKFKDIDVSEVQDTIAIQIIINDLGTFFVAIKEGGEKHIIQAVYNDRDGTLETSYDEMLKIAGGGYDYLTAIKGGRISYQGDLKKAIKLVALFK